ASSARSRQPSKARRPAAHAWPASPSRHPCRRRRGKGFADFQDLPIPMAVRPIPSRSSLLMAPALAWLSALMVVPCALVLALAFFRRGIYGGIKYTFTLENFAHAFDPLYAGIFLNSARIAGLATLIAVVVGY